MLKQLLMGMLLFGFTATIVQAEEVWLSHGDVALRADFDVAEGNAEEDEVVLMLHGTLAHNRMEIVQTMSDLFNEEGVNTLTVNLGYGIDKRAEGMLDCKIEHRHKHEDALEEVKLWMDWLKAKGVKKVTLWGHSRGGNQIAWYASENDSDMISKLLLVAPATWDKAKSEAGYQERFGQSAEGLLARSESLVKEAKDELMTLDGFIYCADEVKVSPSAFVSYYRDDERKNTPTVLKKVDKPVMVFIGTEDDVVTGLGEQLASNAQKNVNVVEIDGADHFFLDLYAEDVVAAAIEFMQE